MSISRVISADAMVLRPSRALVVWVVAVSAAAAVLCAIYLPLPWAIGCCGLIGWRGYAALSCHALLRHPQAIVALRLARERLGYQLRSGEWSSGQVLFGGIVTPWLVVLRLSDAEDGAVGSVRVRVLVCISDQLAANEFRRLRVYLKWARLKVGADRLDE